MMTAPRTTRSLYLVSFVLLGIAGLVTLGLVQGTVLQLDSIETTTTSSDPAALKAMVITAAFALAMLLGAFLLSAGIVFAIAWIRRRKP